MRQVYLRFLMILYIFFKDPDPWSRDPRSAIRRIRAKITRISITAFNIIICYLMYDNIIFPLYFPPLNKRGKDKVQYKRWKILIHPYFIIRFYNFIWFVIFVCCKGYLNEFKSKPRSKDLRQTITHIQQDTDTVDKADSFFSSTKRSFEKFFKKFFKKM